MRFMQITTVVQHGYFRLKVSTGLLILTFLLGVSLFASCAQANPSLRGLKRLYVLIYIGDPSFELAGISKQFLQSRVEEYVRGAGISLMTKEEVTTTLGKPILSISLIGRKFPQGFIYYLKLQILQDVSLARDKSIESQGATTWGSESAMGSGSAAQIVQQFDDLMRDFITKYRSVNP